MVAPYVYDDGGRSAAGRRGTSGDCSVRAVAIATGVDYEVAYAACRAHGFTAAKGMYRKDLDKLLASLGWTWEPLQAEAGKPRVKLHELTGTCIARVSGHFVAIVDGEVRDNHDSRRLPSGGRCVYGVWRKISACN